ncbi:MAG: hypothetical protein M1823_001838 [Watsoniomyces obsoletus]|nr:MAG: hypothetical protein M1823_001838 [Watsoniomyces obsoletus]
MVSVASLLNPFPRDPEGASPHHLPSPWTDRQSSAEYYPAPPAPVTPAKKVKMSKDAPIFVKAKVQGEVRYPPWEGYHDELVWRGLRRADVYPLGRIQEFPRHIPYNSDKKDFLEKTGREAFEVFQYTFKVPTEDATHTVLWDYNVGLVRITPFFKSCKYSKTTPGKMLNSNPGLKDICHSITGGALAAQGYWMPWEAAKHLAATFCYPIRYALVPLFGPDFVNMCYRPEDPNFGRMIISRDVVKRCIASARETRLLSNGGSSLPTPTSAADEMASFANVPTTTTTVSKRKRPIREHLLPPPSDDDSESDTDNEGNFIFPDASCEAAWKSAKRERRRARRQSIKPVPLDLDVQMPPTPMTMAAEEPTPKERRWSVINGHEDDEEEDDEDNDGDEMERDDVRDGDSNASSCSLIMSPCPKRRRSGWTTGEARAAYMLMQLHVADLTQCGAGMRADANDGDEDAIEAEDEADDEGEGSRMGMA